MLPGFFRYIARGCLQEAEEGRAGARQKYRRTGREKKAVCPAPRAEGKSTFLLKPAVLPGPALVTGERINRSMPGRRTVLPCAHQGA
jgi:hypothetical protein